MTESRTDSAWWEVPIDNAVMLKSGDPISVVANAIASAKEQANYQPKLPPWFDDSHFTHYLCFLYAGGYFLAIGEAAFVEQIGDNKWTAYVVRWEFGTDNEWYPNCQPSSCVHEILDQELLTLVPKKEYFSFCLREGNSPKKAK